MGFNRNIYNTRYEIEQKSLPERFYETPKDVIASILEPGNNTFYKLFKILIERTGEEFPYKESEFSTKCFKFNDGTFGCFVTLPKPESVMLCAHIVYVFSPDLKTLWGNISRSPRSVSLNWAIISCPVRRPATVIISPKKSFRMGKTWTRIPGQQNSSSSASIRIVGYASWPVAIDTLRMGLPGE